MNKRSMNFPYIYSVHKDSTNLSMLKILHKDYFRSLTNTEDEWKIAGTIYTVEPEE